jgi:PBP1b-binding outer membrane lipoprotein LpoB
MKKLSITAFCVVIAFVLAISGCSYQGNSVSSSNSASATNTTSLDTTKLVNLINEYKNFKEDKFTPYSWENFSSALSAAQSIRKNDTSTQGDVDRVSRYYLPKPTLS